MHTVSIWVSQTHTYASTHAHKHTLTYICYGQSQKVDHFTNWPAHTLYSRLVWPKPEVLKSNNNILYIYAQLSLMPNAKGHHSAFFKFCVVSSAD